MKQRLSLAVAWLSVLSKFLTKLLQRSIQAFDRSLPPSSCYHDKSSFPKCCFFGFRGLRCQFKPDFGHNLRVKFLQFYCELVRVIAVVEQNGNLRDIDRFSAKVIEVVTQQFNQALVIRHTRFGAVGKKRQTKSINGEMSFDTIGAFVVAKPLGLDTGVARILDRLRVNQQQGRPLWFFLTC